METTSCVIARSTNLPFGEAVERTRELLREAGYGVPSEIGVKAKLEEKFGVEVRSALAASLLKRSGVEDVEHVADGGVPMLAGEGIDLVEGG